MTYSFITVTDCKLAMRITTSAFDSEISSLISSGIKDLQMAGVVIPEDASANFDVIKLAVITYTKMHFGNPDNYDRLKRSYDEQKAQLQMASGYTVWSGANG